MLSSVTSSRSRQSSNILVKGSGSRPATARKARGVASKGRDSFQYSSTVSMAARRQTCHLRVPGGEKIHEVLI